MMAKITQFTCENMTKHVVGIMSKNAQLPTKLKKTHAKLQKDLIKL